MNTRKRLALLAAAVMLLTMVLGSAAMAEGKQRTYFISPKMVGAAYWEYAKEGALKAGEDLGVEVIWNGTPEVDAAKQVNMIQDMLIREVDGLAVAVNDATSMTNVFDEAAQANIPVVTFDSDSSDAERAFYIASDTDEAIGLAFLDCLIQQMEAPKGKIAIMIASPSAANIIAWRDAAMAKLEADYPEIEVVGVYPSNDDSQKAYENAVSFIQANPDLDGILCMAAGETPSACKAVEEAVAAGQLSAGKVKIGGMGIPSMMKDYIANGTTEYCVMWNPSDLGYAATWVLDQLAQGNTIEDGVDIGLDNPLKVIDDTIYIGTFTFNKDTIDQYPF